MRVRGVCALSAVLTNVPKAVSPDASEVIRGVSPSAFPWCVSECLKGGGDLWRVVSEGESVRETPQALSGLPQSDHGMCQKPAVCVSAGSDASGVGKG